MIGAGGNDGFRHAERVEQRDADIFVPFNDQFLDCRRLGAQFRILRSAIEQIEGAEVMHQSGQEGLVRIDPRLRARQDAGGGGGLERVLPEDAGQLAERFHVARTHDLAHGDGQRGGAYELDAQAADRRPQVLRWCAVRAVEGGPGQLH